MSAFGRHHSERRARWLGTNPSPRAVFVILSSAGLASLVLHRRLPKLYRQEDTASIVRLVANVFVVVTSLVLGLMVHSAKNTFEAADRDVHAIATEKGPRRGPGSMRVT